MKLKPRIVGMDPFHLELIKLKTLRAIYYLSNARLYAAIEMACLDIQGKALGRPLSRPDRGPVRDRIPMIAYLFWRYDRPGGGHDMTSIRSTWPIFVRSCTRRSASGDEAQGRRACPRCRSRGRRSLPGADGAGFRPAIDPNGVWSVPTAIRIGQRLEAVGMEYFEDPAWGLEGNAAVRKAVRIPDRTNMYPAKFDDLGPAIRLGAVDIVLTDIHYWEGPRGVKDLSAVCRTFGLGVAMHSGAEFGIELAAMLHTAATIPEMSFAGDAHYHYLTDDIIEGGLMAYEDGAIRVPTGSGLGVALDEDKMRHLRGPLRGEGRLYYARFHQDPYRPDWHRSSAAG